MATLENMALRGNSLQSISQFREEQRGVTCKSVVNCHDPSQRKKHEAWAEFINDSIQILSQVIACRADT